MGTALAVRESAEINPAGFGDRKAIAAIRDRILRMIPGAQDAPADVVWAAAQLAVAYRLDPFNGEIYIMKIGSKKVGEKWEDDYRAHVGIKGLRKKAREQALFMTESRLLSADEVKAARRGDYDPGDIGVECTLWRMDIARQCKQLGIPFKPVIATGFWRVKAKLNRKDNRWEPDNIPNTWTAHDVADKRAEINAIKKAYDLTINVADPSLVDEDEAVRVIGAQAEAEVRHRAPVQRDEYTIDENGDFIFASDAPAYVNGTVPAGQSDLTPEQMAQEYADAAQVTDEFDDNPFNDPTAGAAGEANIDYGAIADRLTGTCKTLAEWAYKLHGQGDGPASKAQYGYLTKAVDDHAKNGHTLVLSVLCRRHVTGDNPCSKNLAAKLLDVLLQRIPQKDADGKSVKGADGKVVYVDNPKYRPDVVECVKSIATL